MIISEKQIMQLFSVAQTLDADMTMCAKCNKHFEITNND